MRDSTARAQLLLYADAKALVAREYREALTLRELAAALASSPRQVERAYAELGSTSFAEDLRARRMDAAAELLAGQPSISVAEIARLVGYRQRSHFARLFCECHGLTPGEYRTALRGRAPHA